MDFADILDMMDDDCDIEGFPIEKESCEYCALRKTCLPKLKEQGIPEPDYGCSEFLKQ